VSIIFVWAWGLWADRKVEESSVLLAFAPYYTEYWEVPPGPTKLDRRTDRKYYRYQNRYGEYVGRE
jgi:hypothetical protein